MRFLAAAWLVFLSFAVSAEAKTFKGEYAHRAAGDSEFACRTIVMEQARGALLEEISTYLASKKKIRDLGLAGDDVAALSRGMVGAKVLDEQWNGRTCSIRLKMSAEPRKMAPMAKELLEQGEVLAELELERERSDEALREVLMLEEKLSAQEAKDTGVTGRYDKAVRELASARLLGRGQSLSIWGKQNEALRAFDEALELAPSSGSVYTARGFVRARAGDYLGAVKDFDAALKLDRQSALAWLGRGMAFRKARMEKLAVRDLSKAIELRPDLASAYYQRAEAMHAIGRKDALTDLKRAADLGHIRARRILNNLKGRAGW